MRGGSLLLMLAMIVAIGLALVLTQSSKKTNQANSSPPPRPDFANLNPSDPKTWINLSDDGYKLKLKTLDGNDFDFSSTKGKVVFLNFWATWCPPCRIEMPSLQKLYNQLKDKVVFVFVTNEQKDTVEKFLQEQSYTLPVYLLQEKLPQVFQVKGVPTTFVISPDSKIALKFVGADNWNTEKFMDFLKGLKNLKK